MNNNKNGLLKVLKILGLLVTVIVALWGLFWKFDTTYAKTETVKNLEMQAVETFKDFQQLLERRDKNYFRQQQVFDLNRKLNFLIERKYRLRDLLRKYPNDRDLKEEYEEVKESIKLVEEQLRRLKSGPVPIE